jgi:hypothetical protein
MLSVITDAQAHEELRLDLDAIVREGARRMLAAALEAESTPTSPLLVRSATRRSAAGGPQRPRPPAAGHHRRRCGRGPCAGVTDAPT